MGSGPNRKANVKGRSKKSGQFFALHYVMARSYAYRSLSGNAMKVFIELRCRYNGSNNGKLSLSLREAAKLLGMSQSSAKRSFDELIEKGFIERKKEGHWYGRKAAEYAVTDAKLDGQPPTNKWQTYSAMHLR